MRLIKIITTLAIILSVSGLYSQNTLDTLLNLVTERNPTILAAGSLLESRKLDARKGLTPDNPQVEFGYMWGDPSELGTRTDFEITQSFDFPTAYSSRSKLSKINQHQAELEYFAMRQDILLQARQAWINRVYLNILKTMYMSRLDYASAVFTGFERKLETGGANQLQVNQSRIKVTALKNKLNLLQREYSKNNSDILNLTGNREIEINDTNFFVSNKIIFDTLITRYQESYLNQLYQTEIKKKEKEVDVVFNQKLPKLSAGYYSEKILDANLRGIKAGITIPLWGNARAVKSAKAEQVYAKTDAERYWQIQKNELKNMYEQRNFLLERIEELEQLLEVSNDELLLRKAMEAGEISLTEYFYESDFYFQAIVNLVEFKKEMFLIETELLKVYN